MALTLAVETKRFKLREAFTISRGTRTEVTVVEARLSDGTHEGRGECVPYPRYGESPESVVSAIEGMREQIAGGLVRVALQSALPAGAARNALDLAFWDLEAKQAGLRVWQLDAYKALGGWIPGPIHTAYTLSLDTPAAMGKAAAANAQRPILKIKLGGGAEDIDRLKAVRAGAPDTRLVVDANEGWQVLDYGNNVLKLKNLGVEVIEQPVPAKADAPLAKLSRPVPLCADESCHDRATLPQVAGKYDMINIKLDKAGGLTEALELRRAGEAEGFRIMVGCMMSTSLGVAPAVLLAAGTALVDLDPPMLLAEDRDPALVVDEAGIHPPEPALWG
ncbi:MAG: N-acetyl-D-Glu racemase DgcA [Pseudomonadota bacterium]